MSGNRIFKPEELVCLAVSEGYICNLAPNHGGEHEAWASGFGKRYVAHSWPRTARPSEKPGVNPSQPCGEDV